MTRRIVDLVDGVAMIVTDLHGDWEAYHAYRERFLQLYEQGAVARWILCGDLIHSEAPAHRDRSLDIMLDVIHLQEVVGPDVVITLLGNHELPHLYGIPLKRGTVDYTPRFEKMLTAAGEHIRQRIMAFIDSLPFYVRTGAGVMISHAGASSAAIAPENRRRLASFSHQNVLRRVDAQLALYDSALLRDRYAQMTGSEYDDDVRYYLAVTDPADPRYGELLRLLVLNLDDPDFSLLWEAFFNRNERGLGADVYRHLIRQFLQAWSEDAPAAQHVLISGHMAVQGGYRIVAGQQLRLASWAHAHPHEAGVYLLLDCATPVQGPEDLIDHLGSVFTYE